MTDVLRVRKEKRGFPEEWETLLRTLEKVKNTEADAPANRSKLNIWGAGTVQCGSAVFILYGNLVVRYDDYR